MIAYNDLRKQLDRYIKTHLFTSYGFVRDVSTIDEYLAANHSEETFSVMLNEYRKKQKISPQELYTRACIDRRLYSKIISKADYRPSKNTVIAFGLALHLGLSDMQNLLAKAGFALSNSSVFDLVILFCLENQIYKIDEVNELLYGQGQGLIGQGF
ncbi:MAG: helix-turn-helix transcriptional regulator [Spirochaetaceae bacterium]|jgi:hypothetical protein|nr:helix-turn-helix transcriptional regulator [Spirochaetaceae bacterium]